MIESQSIQWFPGHMAKTRRIMQSNLKLVDIVVELLDARIPYSSQNPEIKRILGNKPRIILLNKSDNADKAVNDQWVSFFRKQNVPALLTDCKTGKGLKQLEPAARSVLKDELERRERKGLSTAVIRMMIVGVPNVGKSSLINKMVGEKRAKVEDRPGVTRGKQWVKLTSGMELLDMPGVLWPKFDDPAVGEHLAFTGAIKDDVFDIETLAMRFLQLLRDRYPQLLTERYKLTLEEIKDVSGDRLLSLVAKKRGMLLSGAELDLERAAITVMDEFRAGKIGKISLEAPGE